MMDKAAGAAVSLLFAAGAATAGEPMVRHFFGLAFEVPSMIGAMLGCVVTRFIIAQSGEVSRWTVRVPVDALTVLVSFYVVLEAKPQPLTALILGITIGSLGATIIKIAEAKGRKALDALGLGTDDKPAD